MAHNATTARRPEPYNKVEHFTESVIREMTRLAMALALPDEYYEEIGVAVVPGSSFYSEPGRGAQQVRLAFCKRNETLREAGLRLQRLRGGG